MLDKILDSHSLDWMGRCAMFVIFFWFGFLKVIGVSPAGTLVGELLDVTLPFISFEPFLIGLGLFEMIVGCLFLLPRASRFVIVVLLIHMLTTFAVLVLLPSVAWNAPFVPTLEGQYVIKNLALIALALLVTLHARKNHCA